MNYTNPILSELTERLNRCKTYEDFISEFPSPSPNDPDYWIFQAFEVFDEMSKNIESIDRLERRKQFRNTKPWLNRLNT